MTVGVAAICESEADSPNVIVGADRLVTTQQMSAIEHESPNTKIKQIAGSIPNINAVSVFAGDVSWAEILHQNIESTAEYYLSEEDQPIDVPFLADITAHEYRQFVRARIENQLLDHFGIDLDDIQRQHRFKESFINKVMTEIDNAEQEIKQRLRVLIGGVDPSGGHIYEVQGGDQLPHNTMGHAAIGSGEQPASTEFLETEYSKTCDFAEALASVTAATLRARQASGVGGNIDIYAVGENYIERADVDVIEALKQRYNRISEDQSRLKAELRERHTVDWSPQS